MSPDRPLVRLALFAAAVLALLWAFGGCANLRGLKDLPDLYRMVRSGQ